MLKITPEVARIHAHLCGDGYISRSVVKRLKKELINHPRKKITRDRYDIRYTAQNPVLRKNFKKDVKIALKRECVLCSGKRELSVSGKRVFDEFVLLGVGKSREWFIPDVIMKADDRVIRQWLRAFFDDEATVDQSRKRIRIKLVNLNGLKQIKKLLKRLGIKSNITGPNCDKTWYITTKELDKFNNLIGFSEPNKKSKLEKLIETKNW